ncbi:hypothetical protein [Emticicia agri]|uniref:Uncharacterized protein n=1 Tax=Emticicia agri TaxID=2492393 RepID=A0A4Q5M082_9BACT|nr:hypothetical protein [Emticicia agri]RYU95532.1 hypothetical protein EWM59_11600 [Emticicia agri]
MKIRNTISLYIIAICIFSSCAKQTNPLTYTKNQLIFGSGGGFANQVNEYRLLENKRLFFRKNNDSTFIDLGRQKVKTVKKLFETSEMLFQEVSEFNEPGNMYYFVRLQKNGQAQSVVWGRPNITVPEKAKELHKHLMNLVPLNQ